MKRLVIFLCGAFAAAAATHARAEPPAETPAAPAKGVLTKTPRLKHFAEPELPEGVKVTAPVAVVLKLSISVEGVVNEAEVAESGGEPFDEIARAASLKLEFEPAEIDGVPAPVRITYRYELKPPVKTPTVPVTARF